MDIIDVLLGRAGAGGGGGTTTTVIANPEGEASEELEKLQVDNKIYGTTKVVANPVGTATDDLKTVKIGSTIYNISGGEEITGEVSGAIASFSDGANNKAVKSLVVGIEPVQSGSGDPSPSNIRPISGWSSVNVTDCGKNLFDKTAIDNNKWLNISTGEVESSNGYAVTAFIKVEANKPITMGTPQSSRRWFYDLNKNAVSLITTDTYTPTQSGYIRITLALNNVDINTYQIEYGNSATAYEAYTATTYPIALGNTVYGGELNVTTGELTVTHACDVVKNLTVLQAYTVGTKSVCKLYNLSNTSTSCVANQYHGAISNIAKELPAYFGAPRVNETLPSQVGTFAINTDGFGLAVYDEDITMTETDFTSKYENMQVCYPLATPTTVTITPTQVDSLLGNNNIWADSGDSDVVYVRDLNLAFNELWNKVNS